MRRLRLRGSVKGEADGFREARDRAVSDGARCKRSRDSWGTGCEPGVKWRRLFERGQLADASTRPLALLPVTISADVEAPADLDDAAVDARHPQ